MLEPGDDPICPECEERLSIADPFLGWMCCAECGWDERAEEARAIPVKYHLQYQEES